MSDKELEHHISTYSVTASQPPKVSGDGQISVSRLMTPCFHRWLDHDVGLLLKLLPRLPFMHVQRAWLSFTCMRTFVCVTRQMYLDASITLFFQHLQVQRAIVLAVMMGRTLQILKRRASKSIMQWASAMSIFCRSSLSKQKLDIDSTASRGKPNLQPLAVNKMSDLQAVAVE